MIQRLIHIGILAFVCFAVYANGFEHAFQLDSGHTILDNPSVRDLGNIPSFFTDPSTFSVNFANVDYRPVLQTTYALNYWMGGYTMWWWHLTQIVLHLLCVTGLYFLCRRVALIAYPDMRDGPAERVALIVALVFALHPTASGVVNYLSARSSQLTAAFLFPSILLYIRSVDRSAGRAALWGATALYTLALFTKVEALAVLAVYFLYEVWNTSRQCGGRTHFFGDLVNSLNPDTLRRMAPFLSVTAGYIAIRAVLMAPFPFGDSRHEADMGAYEYLLTQLVAWWHYVTQWFAPVGLVADNGSFPIHRSITDPVVLLAAGGWLVVATLLLTSWRTRPYLAFVAISSLALLSPTSSVLPLAEMVNEHRPYMPLALLSIAWSVPAYRLAETRLRAWPISRASLIGALTLVLIGLGGLTWERNKVFATPESYWRDVVEKAPSSRAHLNYGLTFMSAGKMDTALAHFEKALELAPYWYVVHTNLAIAYDHTGNAEKARFHYDQAVEFNHFNGAARTWRGEYHLKSGRYQEALEDFRQSIPKSLAHYRNNKGLATAYAGLGDAENSFAATVRCLELDPAQTQLDITRIAGPFFTVPGNAQAGLDYFLKLEALIPDAWWLHANIATLARRVGDTALARQATARSETLKAEQP
ncbi:MAG: tetratricopeptide repeat protein [Leptospirillia bacterium]